MASTLNLQTIELESTLRPMGENGAPSSTDYNDSMREILRDLASISEFLNADILPLIRSLSSAAALPEGSETGIEGRTVYTDTSDLTSLFYNTNTESPLSIADSFRVVYGIVSGLSTKVNDIVVRVDNLSTSLSTTGQNDTSSAISGLYDLISSIDSQIAALTATQGSINVAMGNIQSRAVPTATIYPNSTDSVQVLWPHPYSDNNYIVTYALQDDSGMLQIVNFSYLPNGTGVLVRLRNTDTENAWAGTVNVQGRIGS